jgi:diguanylate cyclase (GGDEF)-like protein
VKNNNNDYFLVVVDGNGIKGINDCFGHKVGDEAIKLIASALKTSFRDTDFVIRFGGDEFIVIVNSDRKDKEFVERNIERANDYLKTNPIIKDQFVSVSYGIAHVSECTNFEQLFNVADSRMYNQKSDTKNLMVG